MGWASGGEQAARALRLALGKAGVRADQIDYLNAHGSSTPLGDKTETVKALVVPNFDALKSWAKAQGQEKPTNESLVADPAVRRLIKSDLDKRR